YDDDVAFAQKGQRRARFHHLLGGWLVVWSTTTPVSSPSHSFLCLRARRRDPKGPFYPIRASWVSVYLYLFSYWEHDQSSLLENAHCRSSNPTPLRRRRPAPSSRCSRKQASTSSRASGCIFHVPSPKASTPFTRRDPSSASSSSS